ncbi:MAG: hypothetical protein M1480_12740 [Bacteroidetes bacterium]|nr:hypothetical protein [Bacteroidota bacterium]
MSKEITEIQKRILNFLIEQKAGKGIPPTLAEIAKHFGYKNRATVLKHLAALEKMIYKKESEAFTPHRVDA